jgi:fucose 4-O-acetylase-like acetyltransferase
MKRLTEIDKLTGLCITLVVFGHLLLPQFEHLQYYALIRNVIYKFHMPLFMFLSGFLIALSLKGKAQELDYSKYIKSKITKFLPPYILFSTVFILVEFIVKHKTMSDLQSDFLKAYILPAKSSAGFLWYIYVLFMFYLIMPFILKLVKDKIIILLIVGIIFQFINPHITEVFCLRLFTYYFLFVSLGIFAFQHFENFQVFIDKTGWIFLLIFIILVIVDMKYNLLSKISLGLFSIPTFYFLAKKFNNYLPETLATLGINSFYIYLMNTLFIGGLSLIMMILKIPFNYVSLLVLFIIGLYLPVFIKKYIIDKVSFLKLLIP